MTPQSRNTALLVFIIVLLVGILGILLYPRLRTPVGTSVPAETTNNTKDEIAVTYPQSGATVKSPMNLTGQARGPWYFEANLPVKVLDADGQVIGEGHLTADGEWMTQEFVPFSGVVEFKKSTTPTGFVVFMNDNPSGIPQYDKEYLVPVKFADVK